MKFCQAKKSRIVIIFGSLRTVPRQPDESKTREGFRRGVPYHHRGVVRISGEDFAAGWTLRETEPCSKSGLSTKTGRKAWQGGGGEGARAKPKGSIRDAIFNRPTLGIIGIIYIYIYILIYRD